MEPELKTTFAGAFRISNTSMWIHGSHPSIKRDGRWMLHYLAGMTLTWFLSSIVFYSVYCNIKIRDITEACRHGTLGIVAVVISFKYVIMLLYQADTMEMIRAMERDYVSALSMPRAERQVVRHFAERGAKVSKLWFGVAVGTSTLFPLKAICVMIYTAACGDFQKVMVFDLELPVSDERKYELKTYLFLFILSIVYAYYVATIYMAFDPLVPIFMLHCCGQLELAKMQIMQLYPKNGTYDPVATNDKMKRIIQHLQQIYSFSDTARRNFTIVYEMIVKTTTVLIPITLYQIIESLKAKSPSLEFISFGFACLVHIYIPCYYSDMLMEKSMSVAGVAYSCGWEMQRADSAAGISTRRTLLFMMARAGKPLAMTTAFQTISLDSFTEMCRQSYAIFNLMNASLE